MRHKEAVDPDRSFERLYRRHRREVYGSVLRDVRDPAEAEDLTQVTFLNAFRAMRRGDRPEMPRPWLLTIARNVVRRRARQRAERPQEVELDSDVLVGEDELDAPVSADISLALEDLTDAQRRAVLLREIQGRSYAEIAVELDLSVSAVEALLFRARRRLVERLALEERTPVVRRHRGLLALPGLAKLGSFGFSFGRVGAASLVGATAIAIVPIGGMPTTEPRAPAVDRTPSREADVAAALHAVQQARSSSPAVQATVDRAGERRHAREKTKKEQPADQAGTSAQESSSPPLQLAPAEVPTLQVGPVCPVVVPPVQVGPTDVGPVHVPSVSTPPAELPPLAVPEVPDLPLLSAPTS
ncbi:MAG TPA: sigma-70 family RNA polymerase sigma factor [Gaiellaceae bacterium]|nr:sigma-70 family RNA polymerase sigma factor [Gaiellaceae bacterium]